SSEDVNLERLTEAQRLAADGLFAQSMSGYISWLAPKIDELKKTLPDRHRQLRNSCQKLATAHPRTPDIMASLALGFDMLLTFAKDVGAVTADEAADLQKASWHALIDAAKSQFGHQTTEEPTSRFLALLGSALASGRAHVADAKTGAKPVDGDS